MRTDQYIGLHPRAERWLNQNAKMVRYITHSVAHYENGEKEDLAPVVNEDYEVKPYSHITGAWTDLVADLSEYNLKNGGVAREFVQATPWSSGPMYFIALKIDEKAVEESLWTSEEIDNEGPLPESLMVLEK